MKNNVCVFVMLVGLATPCIGMSDAMPENQRIEDFAGFPRESSEPLYYVREYPYTTALFLIATAVGGIIYYNRAQVKKKVRQLLHLLHGEGDDETTEKPAV